MKTPKTLSIFALLLIVAVTASAQTPRRRGTRPTGAKPAATQPANQPTPQPPPAAATPQAPVLLATVNGQNITTADIDPRVRELVEALDARIIQARSQILEMEINTHLLASEAGKRKLTPQQFYDLEVTKKITDPPAAEVTRFIEENREELGKIDPATMRKQVTEYLRGERESAISEALVKRLRTTNSLVRGAPLTVANPPATTVLATVEGRPITAGPINERLKPILYDLRINTYRPEREALDQAIDDMLLLAEANRRGVGPEEIVRTEISDKLRAPTEREVVKFFEENKASLKGDLDSLRNQIAKHLQDQNQVQLEEALSVRLRKGANIRLLITEPTPPAQAVSVDDDPAVGPATATVTIVEFTDFQCPSCASMHPVMEEVLKSYGSKIRFVMRDFPLAMHAQARKAAEAANAAHAQGKFFEYAALLFKRQNALDVPSLKKYATELGLDRVRFDAALDGGKFADEVRHDIAEGELYGVGSTPTFFINGVVLTELSNQGLRAAIDRALATSSTAPKVSAN
jgi:protein-disulfide isomerase